MTNSQLCWKDFQMRVGLVVWETINLQVGGFSLLPVVLSLGQARNRLVSLILLWNPNLELWLKLEKWLNGLEICCWTYLFGQLQCLRFHYIMIVKLRSRTPTAVPIM